MMNGVTGIGVNNSNYQMAFRAKGSKAAYEAIDLASDMAKEFTRPLEEKKINFIRRSVSKFVSTFIREPKNIEFEQHKKFIEQAVKDGIIDADEAGTLLVNAHFDTNKYIEIADMAQRFVYLDVLKQRDPELYKAALQRMAEERVATMTTWEMIKELAGSILKKS